MPSPAGFAEAAGTASEATEAASGAAEVGGATSAPTNKLVAALMASEPNPPVEEVADKWDISEDTAYAVRGVQKVISSLFGTGVPAGNPALLDFVQAGVRTARSQSDGGQDRTDDEGGISVAEEYQEGP